jgi:hypothetical protein
VGGNARLLRTHPPAYASADGVAALEFGGTYPVTRLGVRDPSLGGGGGGLELAVFGYSTLKPTDLRQSAYPAVALTLRATNKGGAAEHVSCPRPPGAVKRP